MADTDDIGFHGDVVLIIPSTDNEKSIRLRVSSTALSLGSSVFKAMFSHRFKEGHELATSSAVEVPLPDDDSEAMKVMCKILHHQNDVVPNAAALSTAEILQIAEASDKYDCTVALRPTSRCWLADDRKEKTSVTERRDLITAAYFFGDGAALAELGRCLILESTDPIWEPVGCHDASPLRKVFELLEAERTATQGKILEYAELEVSEFLELRLTNANSCAEDCTYVDAQVGSMLGQLMACKLWPSSTVKVFSIEKLLLSMREVQFANPTRCTPCDGRYAQRCAFADASKRQPGYCYFSIRADGIENSIKHLCLECFRNDGGLATKECQHKT